MNDVMTSAHASAPWLALGLSALAGTTLGALFFGGLWWTTRRAAMSPIPALWIFSSLLLRMGCALWGFYVVADGHWERMLMCLLGFVIARVVALRLRLPMQPVHVRTSSQEINHAS